MKQHSNLFDPVTLPCGVTIKNRIAKSAMSDSLGDGTGHPTIEQNRLYQRWAAGGLAMSIIGEVQGSADFAEKPGNLVLNQTSDLNRFKKLARCGSENDTLLLLQLGHAGALAYAPISAPKGPSALDLPGLQCAEMTCEEIQQLPAEFARTAKLARIAGFGGVQIHAAHGFLLSQFLSPLFNKRSDAYGGPIANRMKPLLEAIEATRAAVGADFPIAVSGGTYFPGAKSASDGAGRGPYFLEFAQRARDVTRKPLMLTGGFKTREQAEGALATGAVDVVGLARALVLEPALPDFWKADQKSEPVFPRFENAPKGGITAWYTMRLTEIGEDEERAAFDGLEQSITDYENRDKIRTEIWLRHFSNTPTR